MPLIPNTAVLRRRPCELHAPTVASSNWHQKNHLAPCYLLDMAQAWLRLAEITEKFGEALQNVPAPLIMPSGSGQS